MGGLLGGGGGGGGGGAKGMLTPHPKLLDYWGRGGGRGGWPPVPPPLGGKGYVAHPIQNY